MAEMNKSATQGTETKNMQDHGERTVNTVDYRSSAGQAQEQKPIQVVHQPHTAPNSKTSGGVLSGAAASVASTLESAKAAISGDKSR